MVVTAKPPSRLRFRTLSVSSDGAMCHCTPLILFSSVPKKPVSEHAEKVYKAMCAPSNSKCVPRQPFVRLVCVLWDPYERICATMSVLSAHLRGAHPCGCGSCKLIVATNMEAATHKPKPQPSPKPIPLHPPYRQATPWCPPHDWSGVGTVRHRFVGPRPRQLLCPQTL